jgi:hypothetical protein
MRDREMCSLGRSAPRQLTARRKESVYALLPIVAALCEP